MDEFTIETTYFAMENYFNKEEVFVCRNKGEGLTKIVKSHSMK
jgi:hypothetical protein